MSQLHSELEPTVSIIPAPQHLTVEQGTVTLRNNQYITVDATFGMNAHILTAQISAELESASGMRWNTASAGKWESCIEILHDSSLPGNAYQLNIRDNERGTIPAVLIRAGSLEGARYGAQTLRQIIRGFGWVLPILHVEDEPAYAVRGYYLDVTRGRVPTLDWLKHWADMLEFYKYNQLQLYIEHSFTFPSMSEMWRGTDALTPSDITELDAYCAQHGIELVPSVSTFGHQYMSMRTHSFRSLSELPGDAGREYSFIERQEHHTLNISDAQAFEFSKRLIDEYCPLFRSKQCNIGADETFDLGKGASRKLAESKGVARLYADYVAKLCDYVTTTGRQPMFWGDIAVEMPEILNMLPENVILLNWLYAPDITEDKVRLVAQSGATQYVCPAVQAWNSLLPRIDDAWNNISRMSRYGLQYKAAGFMVTDWGDYGHINDPRMSEIGMIYGACGGWQQTLVNRESTDSAISCIHYHDASHTIVPLVTLASQQVRFGWDDLVRYCELESDGKLNLDVLAVDFQNPEEFKSLQGGTVREARLALLQSILLRIVQGPQANQILSEAEATLSKHCSELQVSDIAPVLLAIQGQRLLNDFGLWLAATYLNTDNPENISPVPSTISDAQALATEIEYWWEQYCRVWHTVSKDSELNRLSTLVWRCCDVLHSAAASGNCTVPNTASLPEHTAVGNHRATQGVTDVNQ